MKNANQTRLFSAIQKGATLFVLGLGIQTASARLVDAIAKFEGSTDPDSLLITLPLKLSQTGLYNNVALKTRTVTEGIVAFEVNSPLWTDAASKERFITVPAGTKVTATDSNNYKFPTHTVLIKNFSIDTIYGDSTSRILVETRFIILRPDREEPSERVLGLSYRWRRDQSDADLVEPGNGLDDVHNVSQNGVLRGKKWRYPSKFQCTACHVKNGVLGFNTPQLNRPSKANASINQLAALVTANILTANPLTGKANPTFRWVGLKETGVTPPTGLTLLEWKSRSYLAANCSHCHGDSTSTEGAAHSFDFWTASKNAVVDSTVTTDFVTYNKGFISRPTPKGGEEFPKMVYKGYPESSFVVRRLMSKTPGTQMPPLATYQMDTTALQVIKDWICSLGSRGAACQYPKDQPTDDTYWTTGIEEHVAAMTRAKPLNASFQDQVLVIAGNALEKVSLLDSKGRAISLSPLGGGRYRLNAPIRPGLYFVKTARTVTRIHYLP